MVERALVRASVVSNALMTSGAAGMADKAIDSAVVNPMLARMPSTAGLNSR